MPLRRSVAFVLAIVAFVAPMVAAIVVPDPTWIGGLYDGADGDEAVTLVWEHSSAVVPAGIALLGLIAAFVAAAPDRLVAGSRPLCSPSSRAPPPA